MANVAKFPRVARAYDRMEKAQVEFVKAVAAATGSGDGVRVSKLMACLADLPKLHGLLVTIARAEMPDGNVGTLGGGQTPDP